MNITISKDKGYSAIKNSAKNSKDKDIRYVCNAILSNGYHSSFGYEVCLPNNYFKINFLKMLKENNL